MVRFRIGNHHRIFRLRCLHRTIWSRYIGRSLVKSAVVLRFHMATTAGILLVSKFDKVRWIVERH